jgi:hypothetical protein
MAKRSNTDKSEPPTDLTEAIQREIRKRLEGMSLEELREALLAVTAERPRAAPSKSGTRPATRGPQTLAEGVRRAFEGVGAPITGTEIVQRVQRHLPHAQDGSIRAEVSRMVKAGELTKIQTGRGIPLYELA